MQQMTVKSEKIVCSNRSYMWSTPIEAGGLLPESMIDLHSNKLTLNMNVPENIRTCGHGWTSRWMPIGQ